MLEWLDLPKKESCFVKMDTNMVDYSTGKVVDPCFSGTKITVVQKCNTREGTIYRTEYARENDLDWGLEAKALGLPDEIAPLAHVVINFQNKKEPGAEVTGQIEKQKWSKSTEATDSGEPFRVHKWFNELFRRKK